MTPKEKANELFNSIYFGILTNNGQMDGLNNIPSRYQEAKKCALLCCDEVLGYMGADRGYIFWQEVKSELEKL